MKKTTIRRNGGFLPKFVAILVGLAILLAGVVFGYDRLRTVYLEQCVVTDMEAQVEISQGKMVPAGTLAEELGLKVGANLALIDFTRKREEILERIPNLRGLRISRQLPDRVTVTTEERTPIARMGLTGSRATTGRVVDTDGMVFVWQRGTQSLPTIREYGSITPKGRHIAGRTLAALRLVETCREPEFLELGLLEVDTSKHDFLVATLGNYSKLKILWEGMDDPSAHSRKDLLRRLQNLRDAIRSRVATDTVIWNATLPDRIFADTQNKI